MANKFSELNKVKNQNGDRTLNAQPYNNLTREQSDELRRLEYSKQNGGFNAKDSARYFELLDIQEHNARCGFNENAREHE